MRKILSLILLFVIIVTSFSGNAHNSVRMSYDFLPHDVGNNGSWFLSPQVYDIVALPPDDIQKFHITVNGLWNGFLLPILLLLLHSDGILNRFFRKEL